jgi:ribose transport system substrate-binding protein
MAFVAVLAIGMAACGGGSSSSSSSSTSEAGTAEAAGGEAQEAEAFIAANAKGVGGPLPTSSPKPQPGKSLWILSCSQAASGCARITAAAKEAGEDIGWKVTVIDGEGDVSKWNAGVEQARVAGADALMVVSIDCGPIKGALERAKAAGMITEATIDWDCNDPTQGETEPLFTHQVEPEKGNESWTKTALLGGELQAKWAIAHVEGKKEAIQFTSRDVTSTVYLNEGFEKGFDCGECSIATKVPFHLTELGSTLTQKAQTALVKYPNANVMAAPYDPVSSNAAQAVTNAGRSGSVYTLGEGAENLELIASGGQAMSVAWDLTWVGWAAVDDINRLFDGQKPVYSGWGQGVVDGENLPEGNVYHAPVDYEKNYLKIWGVE